MAKSAHHRNHQTLERHQIRHRRTLRGIHQPTRQRSDNLGRASRCRLLRAIPRITDPWIIQQYVIGVHHCIKRPSARCPTARSPSSIIAFRTEAGNSSHRESQPMMLRLGYPNAPDYHYLSPLVATSGRNGVKSLQSVEVVCNAGFWGIHSKMSSISVFRGCGVVATHQLPKGSRYTSQYKPVEFIIFSPFRMFRKPVPCEQ